MFDVIFADPPYPVSADLFQTLLEKHPAQLQSTGALLIWEIPDTPGAKGAFMRPEARFRKFGATEFLLLDLETLQL
jgi:16S rRNA G966 N2-methylase RsmD